MPKAPVYKWSKLKRPKTGRRSRYGNVKEVVDNISFHSKLEARHYQELKILEAAGKITDLKRQQRFKFIPSQAIHPDLVYETYVADFTYKDENGEFVVMDSKGYETQDFRRKKRGMWAFYGIKIKVVHGGVF